MTKDFDPRRISDYRSKTANYAKHAGFGVIKRRCQKCGQYKNTTGGSLGRGGKDFTCAECK